MSRKDTHTLGLLQRTPSRDNDPLVSRTHRDRDSLLAAPPLLGWAAVLSVQEQRSLKAVLRDAEHAASLLRDGLSLEKYLDEKKGLWNLGSSGETFIMALLSALFRSKRMGQGYFAVAS